MTGRARAATPANPELEAFKVLVATVATRYARRHNWCSVVNQALVELGVDGYVPSMFRLQYKQSSARWDDWREQSQFVTLAEAQAAAEENIAQLRNQEILNHSRTRLDINVNGQTPEQIQAQIVEKAAEIAAKIATIKAPAYPKYRVQEVTPAGNETVVWPVPRRRAAPTEPARPTRARARARVAIA